jgi:hypothetical protein
MEANHLGVDANVHLTESGTCDEPPDRFGITQSEWWERSFLGADSPGQGLLKREVTRHVLD